MKKLKENEMKRQKAFGRTVQVIFILSVILAMYFAVTQAPTIPITKEITMRGWDDVALAGWAVPGVEQSGFVRIGILAHHDSTGTYYNQNITMSSTNASTYGNTFTNNSHNMSSIPYSTTFDIVVFFRWNRTHAKSLSNNTWMLQWVRMNISCPQLHIHNWDTGTGYTNMSKFNASGQTPIHNCSYYYTTFVMNNNGSGYTINKGENVSHCYFQPSAYY